MRFFQLPGYVLYKSQNTLVWLWFFILALFISGFGNELYAQKKNRLFTGIAMFPTIARSNETGTLSKFSLNGELRIRYQVSSYFAIETGPGFINRGFRFKTVFKDSVSQEEWTVIDPWQMNFFTMPFRLRLTSNGFTAAAGISPEIFINSNPSNVNHQIRTKNIAWQFSIGYEFQMYSGGIVCLEFFHSQPFQTVFRGYSMQNTGFSVGVIFPIIGPKGFGG